MSRLPFVRHIAVVCVGLSACGSRGPTDPAAPSGTSSSSPGGTTPAPGPLDCVVDIAGYDDYSYTVDATLSVVPVASRTDDVIDWSGLTTDFRGRAADPTDVTRATYAKVALTESGLESAIEGSGIAQSDLEDFRECTTEGTADAVHLTDCSLLGNVMDPETEFLADEPGITWIASLWGEGETGVSELLASAILLPTDGAAETTAFLGDDSLQIAFSADLHSAPTVTASAGCGDWRADWSTVGRDAHGDPFDPLVADTLVLEHLGTDSIAEVEGALLDLDQLPAEVYYLSSYGVTTLDSLDAATAADGTPFPGFSTDGTWLVGLECTSISCFSPAPKFLAVVQVD